MQKNGWIKLNRKIMDHWICENPLYFKAWIQMIMSVNHQDNTSLINNELIQCKRGQSLLSIQNWCKLFGKEWSIQKVRTFFKLLQNESMIVTSGLQKTTRLTICNYDFYQSDQQTNNEQTTTKKEKKEKEEKKESINNNDFLSKIIVAFQEAYFEVFSLRYHVMNKYKERTAAQKLLCTYREHYPSANSEETISGLKEYFLKCCEIDDNWLKAHMSLPLIVSKFNEINNIYDGINKRNTKKANDLHSIVDQVYAKK